jgi:hypothetical protein
MVKLNAHQNYFHHQFKAYETINFYIIFQFKHFHGLVTDRSDRDYKR